MLTSLDWLVVLFMGLAFTAMLSLAIMFLIKNRIARYVSMGLVLATAAAAAFFGFMVGITGFFLFQIGVALSAAALIVTAIVLTIRKAKDPKVFLAARITASAALVLGMMSAFFI